MENVLFVLILFILLLAYLANLTAGFLFYKELFADKKAHFFMIIGSVLGVSLAVFIYALLYFSVATISHTPEYSAHGYQFAKFYSKIFHHAFIIIMIVLTVLFALSLVMKNRILGTINLAYQATLVIFLIMPDVILASLFNLVGLIDFSMTYFAAQHGIPISEMTIKHDLINTRYSLSSDLKIVGFYFLNGGGLAILIIVAKMMKVKKIGKKLKLKNYKDNDVV